MIPYSWNPRGGVVSILSFFRRLFGAESEFSDPTTRYADLRRATRTGKARARATPAYVERGPGADYRIHDVPGLSESAKKVYLYLSAIADADGLCFPFYTTISRRTGFSKST